MELTIQALAQETPRWIAAEEEETSIVLSSRARLARNLTALPFVQKCKRSDQSRIVHKVETAVRSSAKMSQSTYISMGDTTELDRQFLVERRLISPGLSDSKCVSGAFIGQDESASILVNEEDHLRIQALRCGLQLYQAWQEADRIDTELGQSLDYAFSDDFGYLTACPTNVGTGIRMSVLIHLPGLALTENIDPIIRGMTEIGFAVRGLYGEGTDAFGNLYQVSNQWTLGYSEQDVVSNIDGVVNTLIGYENRACEALLEKAPAQVEDRAWRAYGMLRFARVLNEHDTIEALSSLRLGMRMGLMEELGATPVNRLLIVTQSAHIQKIAGREVDEEERDILRSDLVRKHLDPAFQTPRRQRTDHSS
ncbi:MAG: protein arginine kinase [Candidatus Latescibacteria bacterium]|jgi:protein arginine kinase|nr:protein arginine kinase [Candidatus Latescibacterota bacterium]